MLLLPQKKKLATIVVEKLSNRPKSEGMETSPIEGSLANPMEDASSGKEAAMVAFLSAVEAKDPKAMSQALEDHYLMCEDSEDSYEGED